MSWLLVAIPVATLIVGLLAYILWPESSTKSNVYNELVIVVLLKALITHFGAAKSAQYYLDALESTSDTDHILRGLYKRAGAPGDYVDATRMMTKEGGWTQEQYRQYEHDNAKYRKMALGVLTADLKKAEARFRAETKAYTNLLRKTSHKRDSSLAS